MNNTPYLTNCSYCGRNMSSALEKCPHCKQLVSRIVSCAVCDENLNSTDSVTRDGVVPKNAYERFFHPRCYDLTLAECICPLCKHKFSGEALLRISVGMPCSECGHTPYASICDKCHGYLIGVTNSARLHHTCQAIREAQEEARRKRREAEIAQLKERRRGDKQCILCGAALSILDLFFKREKHQRCRYFRE